MNNFTEEKVFTKLMHMRKYFTPFNWDTEFNHSCETYTIKGITNNRSFKSHYDIYKKICELYPSSNDVNSLIYGFFLMESDNNIYKLSLNDTSEYIAKWNNIFKIHGRIIRNEVESIKTFLNVQKFKINDILVLRGNKSSIIYEMYAQKYIHGLTMAAIYLKSNNIDDMMLMSSEITKSIETKIFISDLYKYIKIKKMLQKLKK